DSGWPATDLTSMASGGLLAYTRSVDRSLPVVLPGMQAEISAGHWAAVAALVAVGNSRAGSLSHMEVSIQEAVLVSGPYIECGSTFLNCDFDTSTAPIDRTNKLSGYHPCKDGK